MVRFPIKADTFMYEIRDLHSTDDEDSDLLGKQIPKLRGNVVHSSSWVEEVYKTSQPLKI